MIKDIIQNHGTEVSILLVLIIVAFAAWGYYYIDKKQKSNELLQHRGIIEMIPSLVSTLGVLGTFLGITLGLLFFDTSDLTSSIPLLLDGLKTAFFTSLTGMIGSLILSSKVNKLFDEKTGGISDSAEAAGIVVNAVQALLIARNFMRDILEKQNVVNITIENHYHGEINQLTINSD